MSGDLNSSELRWRQFVEECRRGEHPDYEEHWQLFQALTNERSDENPPVPVWRPGQTELKESNLAALTSHTGCGSYRDLHRWSVENRADFWIAVIDRLGLQLSREPDTVLDLSAGVEHPVWLPGAELNIVDSCFQAAPDATAIVHADESDQTLHIVTYGELEALVNRIANGLRENGFAKDEAIVLYMPMTVECVAAYLGIIRAGCRVVSVADSFAAGELRKRMEIAGASAVICLASYSWAGRRIDLYEKVRQAIDELESEARCILIRSACEETPLLGDEDLLWDDLLSDNQATQGSIGWPDRVTNVLFSSGTTGTPKAVPWTQLTPIKCAMDGHFHQDIHPGDVVAWPTNIGWMMGPWLIYAALLNRASMALYGGAPHGEGFTRFVNSASITMLGLVPALVRAWKSKDLVAPNEWKDIKVFSSTGEVSNAEDYLWLMSRSGYRAPVIEYLGGTEIGGGHITGSVLLPASPSTFSTPALGLDFVILDESNLPVAPGQMGELYLVPPSIGLSQTLLNKDHHESYYAGCPDGPDSEVLRRHGDQFTQLAGGFIKAQGRADDTMNLGGIKVSSIELEEVINEHPAVFESAAVSVRLAGEGAESLVVFVVLADETEVDSLMAPLRKRIATELNPLFKIHEVVPIAALPRTASNKVMRRKLRDQYKKEAQA